MITPAYAAAMARYNTWQNDSLYSAAATLSEAQRHEDRGAFFGSIHKTFNHLIWADQMWLARFAASEMPEARSIAEGLDAYPDFKLLRAKRQSLDHEIEVWASALTPSDIAGNLTFHSISYGSTFSRPRAAIITHIFNHQTHHRGQVHALLTGFGVKPGPTDIPVHPEIWEGLIC